MIKIILWDIDGTLLDFKAQQENALKKCFELFSLGGITQEMYQEYDAINNYYWQLLEKNLISKEEVLIKRFDDFFKKYNLVCSSDKFNHEYHNLLGETIVFNDDSYNLVNSLRSQVRQYAVTNGSLNVQRRKLSKSGLQDLFDDIFISDLIGINKPNIGFFDYVFSHIEMVDKSEIIIVGDSLTSDIQGGINAKIKTCFYNKEKKRFTTSIKPDYEISSLNEILEIIKD